MNNDDDSLNDDYDDDDDDDGDGKGIKRNKSRRELPGGAVATLKAWLLSPEHFTHPYPTPQDQAMLMSKTGIDKKQLKNWFTNARRRIWKPMLKKQIESGKLTTSATATMTMPSGGMQVVQVPGGATLYHHHPGFTLANGTNTSAAAAVASAAANLDNPHSVQAMRVHYQQAMHEQQQNQQQQQQNQQQQVRLYLSMQELLLFDRFDSNVPNKFLFCLLVGWRIRN